MTLRSQFKTDPKAIADGVWFDYPANADGSIPRFKLARLSSVNPKYARLLKEVQARNEGIDLSDAEREQQANALFVDASILAWENFQPDHDGENWPYSRENAILLVNNAAWRDLVDDLRLKALKANGFLAKQIEATTKNS
jgi:hypothetical protein